MRKILVIGLIGFTAYWVWDKHPDAIDTALTRTQTSFQDLTRSESIGDQVLRNAFDNRLSDVLVKGEGEVVHLLADDNQGSRHQKFILKLSSGQTLLVAHNIDLAPRIRELEVGDRVEFSGEFEWNEKGGVIHWTHHDPQGHHQDGWLKHQGRIYQ